MMTGAAGGRGGSALGNHLANTKEHGAGARAGESRGLVGETTREQIAELTAIASRARTTKPLYHVFARPQEGAAWKGQDFRKFWESFEKEFGLERQPFAEATHDSDGHQHRVYSLVKRDGTTIRMSQDFARREKLERVTEFDRGERFVVGGHNKAVIRALATERPEIAAAMHAANMHKVPRPVAALSPQARAQQDRTNIKKADIAAATAAAWNRSDSGTAFQAALLEQGLRLARGDKCPLVVDKTGNTHSLRRLLSMDAKGAGGEAPKEQDIRDRLDGLSLPTLAEAKQQPLPENWNVQPVPTPPEPPPTGEAAQTAPAAEPRAAQATETVPSRDACPPASSVGGGGVSGGSASTSGGPSAALTDLGDGPGEPPGPGASPAEQARYRARLAAYEERKGAAWAAYVRGQQGEGPHAAVQSGRGQYGIVQQEGGSAAAAANETNRSEDRWHEHPDIKWNDGAAGCGGEGSGRNNPKDTREHEPGVGLVGGPDRSPAVGGTITDIGNSTDSHSRLGRSAADRAAARAYIKRVATARRLETGIAGMPEAMAALRLARAELSPRWRERRDAHRRVQNDCRQIADLLATHPYLTPADLDPIARANAYAGRLSDADRERRAVAEAAAVVAEEAVAGRSAATRFLAALGIATPEQHRVERMVRDADALAEMARRECPRNDDYRYERTQGETHAYTAQRTLAAWEQRPEVALAMRDHRLNELVAAAMKAGDTQVTAAIKAGNPTAARAIILAREQHEERQHALLDAARNGPENPSSPTGPKRK